MILYSFIVEEEIMKSFKISIFLCFLPALFLSATGMPDRLQKGQSLAALETYFGSSFSRNEAEADTYFLDLDSDEHPFARIICGIHPTLGLYMYSLIGKPLRISPNGTELKDSFKTCTLRFETRFGKARKEDYLKPDSTLRAPGQWLESLQKKERVLRATWYPTTESLGSVILSCNSNPDSMVGYTIVTFTYDNYAMAKLSR